MNKFVAAAAVSMAALALHSAPAPAATETAVTPPPSAVALPPASPGPASGRPETPRFHGAASGVAVLMWAAATAGLITTRSGWNRRWRRARRRTMSDEELRELVGIRPNARPAI